MLREVSGIPLNDIESWGQEALAAYEDITEGRLTFHPTGDEDIIITPEKPYSARLDVPLKFDRQDIGKLAVICFAPEDGTGNEDNYTLAGKAVVGDLPRHPKIVPRLKVGINTEAMLTIAEFTAGAPQLDPALFAGCLNLIGFNSNREIAKIGEVGHARHLAFPHLATLPRVTYTTGYKEGFKTHYRFGDPHALYNSSQEVVTVAGFLAVDHLTKTNHPSIFKTLKAADPILL